MPILLVALALLLVACGGDPSSVTWRNVTFEVPEGWHVFEETDTRLSLLNQPFSPEVIRSPDDVPGEDVVAIFFTDEPATVPDDWRRYTEQQDATLEEDEAIILGDGVPAPRFVFDYATGGIPLREMVVVIPSRHIVALAQPVPRLGQQDGPEVFLEHRGSFEEILKSAEFGRRWWTDPPCWTWLPRQVLGSEAVGADQEAGHLRTGDRAFRTIAIRSASVGDAGFHQRLDVGGVCGSLRHVGERTPRGRCREVQCSGQEGRHLGTGHGSVRTVATASTALGDAGHRDRLDVPDVR